MDLMDIVKFCTEYPALVIAIILGIVLWSMVIMISFGRGGNNAEKGE